MTTAPAAARSQNSRLLNHAREILEDRTRSAVKTVLLTQSCPS
jgi:hypothetical protein